MNLASIKEEFRQRVSEKIELEPQGQGRFLVLTPFRFEDGDHFTIALKRDGEDWVLTDEANTIMHLSYWMDTDVLESEGNRKQIVDSALAAFSVQNRDGELVLPVVEGQFGDALFSFIQALSKVTDVSFLSREIVRSTFMEDLEAFLRSKIPADRIEKNWNDVQRDPKGNYLVDFRVNHMKKPLFIYGIPNEDKMKEANINLLMFEKWNLKFHSIGIFEDMESMPRKPLTKFLDIAGKPFSSLDENRDRIAGYLDEAMQEGIAAP